MLVAHCICGPEVEVHDVPDDGEAGHALLARRQHGAQELVRAPVVSCQREHRHGEVAARHPAPPQLLRHGGQVPETGHLGILVLEFFHLDIERHLTLSFQ